jgi:Carboxypeptidase regulatory-like domain
MKLRSGLMKILATTVIVVFALASPVQAGPLPQGVELGDDKIQGESIENTSQYGILIDGGPTSSPVHVPPPAGFDPLAAQNVAITIVEATGTMFTNPPLACAAWPANAKAAFSYAASIWASQLNSSVPIKINACWTASLTGNTLGRGGTTSFRYNFTNAPRANTLYPVALANALAGTDLNTSQAEMDIAYNSNITSWYFGTDGNPAWNQTDFVSVVLHEMAHGLGFLGTMSVSSGQGSWGLGSGYPGIYDRFTENGAGQQLINTALFPNPSAALATQLTGGDVWFDGPNARAGNSGNRARLYAPGTWSSGSSYSHLNQTTYEGSANTLMVPVLMQGTSIHSPGPIVMGIYKDLGWTTGPVTYSVSGRVATGSGTGIQGVTVSDGAGHTATTNANGDYTLSGLAAGTYTLTPSRAGYTFSPVTRTVSVPPSRTGQNFTGTAVVTTYTISGRVATGSGTGIQGATISDGAGHTATTNSSGYYTLSGLVADTYTLTPSRGGCTFSPTSRVVSVPPSRTGQNFTGTCSGQSHRAYLPAILKLLPTGPQPGYWQCTNCNQWMYVRPDRAAVLKFTIRVTDPDCGTGTIYRVVADPIVSNQFAFSGSFYGSGTFHTATTASGTTGLNNFYISACGKYVSGGPWTWSDTWRNSTQPAAVSADVDGTEVVELSTDDAGDAFTVTVVQ